MILTVFTLFHVALSLAGLIAGLVAVLGLVRGRVVPGWTGAFLGATLATSLTGFLFPSDHFTPAHGIGIVSLVGLAAAIFALYGRKLRGGWRRVYAMSSIFSLYLNILVAIVQAFQKIPILTAAAPTQSEPPFVLTQVVVMVVFIALGWRAWSRFPIESTAEARGHTALAG